MRLVIAFAIMIWGTAAVADPAAITALNQYREAKGRSALSYSRLLEKAAEAHAQDMRRGGFFSHTGRDGSSVADRVRAQGYGFCLVAENIAKGQRSLAEVMQSWAKSKPHRRNLLQSQATEFALVRARGDIWVMVLARPGC